jgi:multiple sugar transport system permease protein
VYFLPVASTLAAMSIVWQFMYYPKSGLIDRTLGQLIGVQDWLHSTTWALPALSVVGNWQSVGIAVIIFLAGIAAVPDHLTEAARMDGARRWSQFWNVTWPAIRPATVAAAILTSQSSISMFDQVKVMTQGGPLNSTETLAFALYQRGFTYVDIGGGAVLTIALLALLVVVALLQFLVLGRDRLTERLR